MLILLLQVLMYLIIYLEMLKIILYQIHQICSLRHKTNLRADTVPRHKIHRSILGEEMLFPTSNFSNHVPSFKQLGVMGIEFFLPHEKAFSNEID